MEPVFEWKNNYPGISFEKNFYAEEKQKVIKKDHLKYKSGRLDSNQRPLAPHANTLPDCATSRTSAEHLFSGAKCKGFL